MSKGKPITIHGRDVVVSIGGVELKASPNVVTTFCVEDLGIDAKKENYHRVPLFYEDGAPAVCDCGENDWVETGDFAVNGEISDSSAICFKCSNTLIAFFGRKGAFLRKTKEGKWVLQPQPRGVTK